MLECIANPLGCAVSQIPVEWIWGTAGALIGLLLGFLWGKFGVLGLLFGIVGGVLMVGHLPKPSKPVKAEPQEREGPFESLFSRFRKPRD